MKILRLQRFFASVNDAHSTLKYVENKGSLTVGHTSRVSDEQATKSIKYNTSY